VFVGWEFGGDPSSSLSDTKYKRFVDQQCRMYEDLIRQDKSEYLCLKRDKWYIDMGINPTDLENELRRKKLAITEAIQVYFSILFRQMILNDKTWGIHQARDFYVKEFCAEKELQVNLFPVQAQSRRVNHPERLLDAYGIRERERASVEEMFWKDERRPNTLRDCLQAVLNRDRQSTVIMMGCEDKRQEICERIFPSVTFVPVTMTRFFEKTYKHKRHLFHSEDQRIWFTQHPSGGWLTRRVVDYIVDSIANHT
jgi:hypothetical protein